MSVMWLSTIMRRRQRSPRHGVVHPSDAGYAALELVVLTPIMLLLLMFVVGAARLTHAQDVVQQAASTAARTATLDNDATTAKSDGTQAGDEVLSGLCTNTSPNPVTVDTSEFHPGGQVTVSVRCTLDMSDLSVPPLGALPFHKTVHATATSPLEQFRQFDEGTG